MFKASSLASVLFSDEDLADPIREILPVSLKTAANFLATIVAFAFFKSSIELNTSTYVALLRCQRSVFLCAHDSIYVGKSWPYGWWRGVLKQSVHGEGEQRRSKY